MPNYICHKKVLFVYAYVDEDVAALPKLVLPWEIEPTQQFPLMKTKAPSEILETPPSMVYLDLRIKCTQIENFSP